MPRSQARDPRQIELLETIGFIEMNARWAARLGLALWPVSSLREARAGLRLSAIAGESHACRGF
jgi:hypothetical protein